MCDTGSSSWILYPGWSPLLPICWLQTAPDFSATFLRESANWAQEPALLTAHCCTGQWAKSPFYVSKWLKKIRDYSVTHKNGMKFKFQRPQRSHIHVLPCCQWILAAMMQRGWLWWAPDVGPMAHVVLVAPHATRCNINRQRFKPPAHSVPWCSISLSKQEKKRKVDSVSQIGVRGCVDSCVTEPLQHRACFAMTPELSPKDASSTHRPDWGSSEPTDGMVRKGRKFKAEHLNKAEQLTNCELSRSRLIAAAMEMGPSK